MHTITIERVPAYDPELIRSALRRLLAPLGGMAAFVHPGERVLLKPNLLAAKTPDQAVTTHPAVLQAVIEEVQAAGGVALVGDSPGIGGLRRVAEKSGLLAVIEATGAELVAFDQVREVATPGTFKRFELAAPYLAADRVINLPKLKTHEMMTLTCGVKNLFGAVVGAEKPAWHLKAGADRELFARMLLELYLVRPPDLTIVDAVVAMEGNGPGSGDPRQVGLLLAGVNPVAVDVIAAEIAGLPKQLLHVERTAERLGLAGADRGTIETVGIPLAEAKVAPFKLPHLLDVQFGLPRFLKDRLRHQLTTRPIQLVERCKLCGICVAACPPRVIAIKEGRLRFDYHNCIRCFCCRELCPDGALGVQAGWLLRLLKRRREKNSASR
jgi:uncharacterized protein (DUF362 family)/Pyruvate/2-oxoacid:ferredoxin oxidoreductase delta subunit